MSKAQYITAMTLSVLLMLVAIGVAIGSLGTLSKADEKGNVVVHRRGGKAEYPAHFVAFFGRSFCFLWAWGLPTCRIVFYHDE